MTRILRRKVADDKDAARTSHDFLEAVGFNSIADEKDAKNRMADIERFTAAFPDSQYQEQVSQLRDVHVRSRAVERFRPADCVRRKEPAGESELVSGLAAAGDYYADANSSAKAITYAQKA